VRRRLGGACAVSLPVVLAVTGGGAATTPASDAASSGPRCAAPADAPARTRRRRPRRGRSGSVPPWARTPGRCGARPVRRREPARRRAPLRPGPPVGPRRRGRGLRASRGVRHRRQRRRAEPGRSHGGVGVRPRRGPAPRPVRRSPGGASRSRRRRRGGRLRPGRRGWSPPPPTAIGCTCGGPPTAPRCTSSPGRSTTCRPSPVTPDGDRVVATGNQGGLWVWDIATGRVVDRMQNRGCRLRRRRHPGRAAGGVGVGVGRGDPDLVARPSSPRSISTSARSRPVRTAPRY
jgi:hypothetical protein